MTPDEIKALVRTIPDFPKTGIQFRDITTLLGHGRGFAATVDWLTQAVAGAEAIAGMEARGFESPLQNARFNGHDAIVEVLLAAGAKDDEAAKDEAAAREG